MYRFSREKILPVFLSKGWTTYGLAKRAGVGWRVTHKAINGGKVSAVIVGKIAAALDIDPLEYLEPVA